MSDITTFGQLLTAASEASALENNDRLLAFGADGALKKISQENANLCSTSAALHFYNNGENVGRWLRLGYFLSNVGVLNAAVMNEWHSNSSKCSMFSVCVEDNSTTVPKVFVNPMGFTSSMFPKLRIVNDTSSRGMVYVDLYMSHGANSVMCSLFGMIHFVPNYALEEATVPSGWTVSEVSLLRGGVNTNRSTTCDFSRKGGSPDGGREGFIERVSEVGDVGHNVVTVFHFGRECSLETWNLRHRRWLCESSIGYISIWNALCMQGRLLRVSGVFDISESPSYLPKAYRQRKQFHGLVSVNIADERRWAA